jgi:hypothetical protein
MTVPRLAVAVGGAFLCTALMAGSAYAAEWSPTRPWWCGQMSPNVCQYYSGPDSGTSTYRHDCLLNEGWHSEEDVTLFCFD